MSLLSYDESVVTVLIIVTGGQACQKSSWKTHKPGELLVMQVYRSLTASLACRERVSIKQTSKAIFHGKTLPPDAPIVATATDGNIYTYTSV